VSNQVWPSAGKVVETVHPSKVSKPSPSASAPSCTANTAETTGPSIPARDWVPFPDTVSVPATGSGVISASPSSTTASAPNEDWNSAGRSACCSVSPFSGTVCMALFAWSRRCRRATSSAGSTLVRMSAVAHVL
jgi:hypothetical protein